MDPYLEHPAHWGAVHQGAITFACAALNRVLPARYAADIGERLVLVEPDRDIYPDVFVVAQRPTQVPGGGAVALVDPPLAVRATGARMREPFVQIVVPREHNRVVATLELLSPANKSSGSHAQREYRRKQQDLLASDSHLLEIDLLRGGTHTVAVAPEAVPRPDGWHGVACLHRGGTGPADFDLWPIMMTQRLPRVAVPLLASDADAPLDLQAVFDRCYDELGFARRVDYGLPAPSSLSATERLWASARIRDASP